MNDATVKGLTPLLSPDQTCDDPHPPGDSGGDGHHAALAEPSIPLVIDPEFQGLIPPLLEEDLA
jgi:hypothetical protein